jgi:hypothetical protein
VKYEFVKHERLIALLLCVALAGLAQSLVDLLIAIVLAAAAAAVCSLSRAVLTVTTIISALCVPSDWLT